MEEQFKCIKQFVVDQYDEHETLIENESIIVPIDSIWTLSEHAYLSEVRLDSNQGLGWLEITLDDFKECFIEV